ncbi:ceramide kinase-like [Lytechinus pictus]|uniref:ceramide kinase-like n=1 Tax=Lytechinus pictus TaxID=7653 RepID=UPI0030B9DE38
MEKFDSDNEESSSSVDLQATFDIEKKPCDVRLSGQSITWWEASSTLGRHHQLHNHQCIQLNRIVGIRLKGPEKPSTPDGSHIITLTQMGQLFQVFTPSTHQPLFSFTVYVGRSSRHMKWKVQAVTFCSHDQELCLNWVDRIKTTLQQGNSRPKRLHVIVNPFGGKGKGQSIYESKVAPLFDLADIETSMTITEGPDHAKSLMQMMDLTGIDGIVSVGGDGTFADIVNGLLIRTQEKEGIDPNNPASVPVPLGLRVGIIPAGSTDVMAYDTTGVNDPVTSALQIILGFSLGLDVCSVHHNNSLLRYTVSFMGYGFLGDVLKESENYRWMGPSRYEFAGVKKYLRHQDYLGEVAFLPSKDEDNTPWDKRGCRIGCGVCSKRKTRNHHEARKKSDYIDSSDSSSKWRHVRGHFTAINAALVSGRCSRTVTGMSPAAHLGNGCLDLVLVRKCSRFDYLRHMLKLASSGNHFNFDFVEVHRAKAFKFRSLNTDLELAMAAEPSTLHDEQQTFSKGSPKRFGMYKAVRTSSVCSTSSWNMDGEVGEPPDIDVRVHCQLIKVFAQGPDTPDGEELLQQCCFCQSHNSDPYEIYSTQDNDITVADERPI